MDLMGRVVLVVTAVGWWVQAAPLSAQAADSTAANAGPDSARATAAAASAKLPVNVSGFVTASYTYTTRHGSGNQIVGRLYDRFQDQVELNAAKVVLEKPVATDKWDAGARVDLLFGQNAAVIKSAGLNLGDHADLTQAFVTVNLPGGGGEVRPVQGWEDRDAHGARGDRGRREPEPRRRGTSSSTWRTSPTPGSGSTRNRARRVDFQLALFNGWDVVEDNNTRKSLHGAAGTHADRETTIGLLGFVGNEKTAVSGVTPSGNRYGGEVWSPRRRAREATVYLQGDYGEEKDALARASMPSGGPRGSGPRTT